MEKNKYYTPDIKEFRIGFEYEEEDDLEDNVWIKRTLDFSYDWLEIHKDFANDKRVKLLDKEDIESFGFKLVPRVDEPYQISADRYTMKDIDLLVADNTNRIQILGFDKIRHVCIDGTFHTRCLFEGIIKNKSELEVVLKQIGVI